LDIQRELNGLKQRADSKKLISDDFNNGTFTVSNIGKAFFKFSLKLFYYNQLNVLINVLTNVLIFINFFV
jgi:pyruvate/2-oxoglutarate dehydrogenase complex dihydrolipoamide acyltransferase (E2) component